MPKFAVLNYYSHYYFDRKEGDCYHNFGLLLPDFVRNFTSKQRILFKERSFDQPLIEAIHHGVAKHFSIDKTFHGCAFFKKCCALVEEVIKEPFAKLEIPRFFFAAHILVELIIDRLLIKEDNGKGADMLYVDLAQLSSTVVAQYWDQTSLSQFDEFWERFNKFCEIRYLYQYVNNHNLAFSLSRIYLYSKATPQWSEEQILGVSQLADKLEYLIAANMEELKNTLK